VTREWRVHETDPALIREAVSGDLGAVEQIVRAHQQEVWRFLRRLLGDDGTAEDVAQETFLRMYRRLPTFAFQSKFSTWVFQIARNAAVDELRARKRRARAIRSVPPAPASTGGEGPTRVELDAALASLPVDLREALLLIEVLGLRYAEAATVLTVPVGTVKSRVFAARVRLAAWARAGEADGPDAEGDVPTVQGPER
jgi:RNA polymerase sigma-70 factor (ECF subfamily)